MQATFLRFASVVFKLLLRNIPDASALTSLCIGKLPSPMQYRYLWLTVWHPNVFFRCCSEFSAPAGLELRLHSGAGSLLTTFSAHAGIIFRLPAWAGLLKVRFLNLFYWHFPPCKKLPEINSSELPKINSSNLPHSLTMIPFCSATVLAMEPSLQWKTTLYELRVAPGMRITLSGM